ncbi:MAG: lipid-A-disaccharide synthase [Rhodospirillaceae bacterium]|jgi:lipid-A-disaccharide synthase
MTDIADENEPPLIYIIAGEPSGDNLGALLMKGLRERTDGKIQFAGIGGPKMTEQGLDSLFPMEELSVMGFVEVLPHIPNLMGRIKQTVSDILRKRPVALITIDSPGFCFRVAKNLAGLGIALIHYVAPTVWAWRPGRAKKIAAYLDHILALLPFEPTFLSRFGVPSTFVGHSVVESGADQRDGDAFRKKYDIDPDVPLICVLPGSRRSETRYMLPVFGQTLGVLQQTRPNLVAVVPMVSSLSNDIMRASNNWPVPTLLLEDDSEKFDAFAASDVALAASGTVSLELAMARTPSVIAYKVNPITAWFALRLVRVEYVNLVNILLDRLAIPEYLQNNCTPEQMASAVNILLDDEDAQQAQKQAYKEVLKDLGIEDELPSLRAADVVLQIVDKYADARKQQESDTA